MLTLVLATTNDGKLAELRALLADLPIEVASMASVLPESFSVVETGKTFEENAVLKARAVCEASGLPALADDSGLEVDGLGGRPGVRSRRFAHERATDAENNAALLRELTEVETREARFRCVLALATPFSAHVQTVEGVCEGSILRAPRGSGGFGYDPLFVLPGEGGHAMAELSEDEKNAVSHRGRAVRALRPLLISVLNELLDQAERIAG
jgi:XTP/dITP diphosphohydrolase